MSHKYNLVIFDCDGVLVDSEAISCGVIADQATSLGHPMSVEESMELFAGGSLDQAINYVEHKIGRKVPDDFEAIYRQRTYAAFEKELQPVEGIRSVLEQITLPKCVGSNGPKYKIELNLRITNLLHFFNDDLFSAYDIQRWKPLPDLYLIAAKAMGFEPKNCLVVEDSTHGVKAAKAAGMDVLGYSRSVKKQQELKKFGAFVFDDMAQLPQLLNI